MIRKYYEGTSKIIHLSTEIGKLLGIIDAAQLRKPKTELRKKNQIKTIHSSLKIEGNTLSLEQVTAIFDRKRVIGPAKDIKEVQNAIRVYQELSNLDAFSQKDYLLAHQLLMEGLIERPGEYRTKGVGIFKGEQVAHVAPPAWNVAHLMTELFDYLINSEDHLIIKSCVFHYEMEFIHPFMDGNGRMGRLWQTVILMQENPVFEFLPIELEIQDSQQVYYDRLAQADREGIATRFVEYMLDIIQKTLKKLVEEQRHAMTEEDRIQYFMEHFPADSFTRKDYLSVFLNISPPTASRDLKKGVILGYFKKSGTGRITAYQKIKNS